MKPAKSWIVSGCLFILLLFVLAGSGAFAVHSRRQVADLTSRVADRDEELEAAKQVFENMRAKYLDASAEAGKANASLLTLEKQVDCGRHVEIDYTSNATASESLKRYLEDTVGSIERAEWDVLWTNSSTALHKLTGEYLWLYLVYFDEPDMRYTPLVYDISKRCYLDRPDKTHTTVSSTETPRPLLTIGPTTTPKPTSTPGSTTTPQPTVTPTPAPVGLSRSNPAPAGVPVVDSV